MSRIEHLSKTSPLKRCSLIPLVYCFVLFSISLIALNAWFGSRLWENYYFTRSSCPIQKYDYTLLTLRWPPGICKSTDCIDQYPQRWLIHGLWPNYNNGSWPQFCCPSTPFDASQIEPIRQQLEYNWANLENGRDLDSLWQHEWNKHGTCSSLDPKLRGQLNYFNYTLSLFDHTQVSKWLAEASITPDDSQVYEYSRFHDAIYSKFKNKFVLQCHKIGSKVYLEQIEFCFDKVTFKHHDCAVDNRSCKKGFLYTMKT